MFHGGVDMLRVVSCEILFFCHTWKAPFSTCFMFFVFVFLSLHCFSDRYSPFNLGGLAIGLGIGNRSEPVLTFQFSRNGAKIFIFHS